MRPESTCRPPACTRTSPRGTGRRASRPIRGSASRRRSRSRSAPRRSSAAATPSSRPRSPGTRFCAMRRTRFAPSPTGSLHVGNALSAVANRSLGDWMLLRIDDTDPQRNVPGGEDEIIRDLEWLGLAWEDGPIRQSERQDRYREAGAKLGERFDGITLLREDGTATYHLASVVDDADFGITHIVRGFDHRPNEELHRRLFQALRVTPPEFVHHGLILGEDGKKLAKRAEGATVASLREAGIPAEAVRAYLEELGIPRHDVHLDLTRIRRLATDAIGALSD